MAVGSINSLSLPAFGKENPSRFVQPEPLCLTRAHGEFLVRIGVLHQTTPLSEGPGCISTTPSGSAGSVSNDGALIKHHDTHHNPIRLVRMVEKIESMARRL